MRTPATRDLRALAAAAFAVSLAGCGVVEEMRSGEEPEIAVPTPASKIDARTVERIVEQADDCLLVVWEKQAKRDIAFDRQYDKARGGAISCATGSSPSQFAAAIAAIRNAAESGNKARILREVGIPLMFIDRDGQRRALQDPAVVDAVFDEVFDGATLDMLRRIDLEQMTVVPEQKGGFFALGSLWLVVDEPGARPRIATVNRQAIAEAADAAREKAGTGAAPPAPLGS